MDVKSKLTSIKISLVRRLMDSNFHPWKKLAAHFLSPLEWDSCFHPNHVRLVLDSLWILYQLIAFCECSIWYFILLSFLVNTMGNAFQF